jgi:uncharacterized protein involved in exopolysaccharide biosynthesis
MTENTSTPVIAGPDPQSMSSSPQDDDEISLLDLLQVLADNLRLLILGPIVAGVLALGYSFTITPIFTATTKFMPPQQLQSGTAAMLAGLGALGGLAGAAGIKSPADQYVAFLRSNNVQDALIDRFKLMERLATTSREGARSAVGSSVAITNGKDGFISIEVSDKDPVFAAKLANAHVEELGKLLSRLAVTEAQQRRLFYEKQLATAKDNLIKAEQALAASGVNSSVLKTNGTAVAALAQLKGQIAGQEIKLASMRGYLAENAPDFKQALIELSVLRVQMARAEKAESVIDLRGSDGDYIAKLRNFKYYETLFELFTRQYDAARIDESREGALIQVLDAAQPPENKSKPKKAQVATMSSLAVGFALLLFVFIRHAVNIAVRDQTSAVKLARLKSSILRSFGRGQ